MAADGRPPEEPREDSVATRDTRQQANERARSGSPLALVPDEHFSPPPPALPLSERCPGLSIYGSSITSTKR
jgi:hypothetical protein